MPTKSECSETETHDDQQSTGEESLSANQSKDSDQHSAGQSVSCESQGLVISLVIGGAAGTAGADSNKDDKTQTSQFLQARMPLSGKEKSQRCRERLKADPERHALVLQEILLHAPAQH